MLKAGKCSVEHVAMTGHETSVKRLTKAVKRRLSSRCFTYSGM